MRILTPYEYNYLRRHGIDPDSVGDRTDPVEYLAGYAPFCGREFVVTPDVLIPRIETEELVKLAVSGVSDRPITVADVGTGSGCIGISVSLALSDRKIPHRLVLSDISRAALVIARTNVRRLLPSAAVVFLESDLCSGFANRRFDLILANLPYLPTRRLRRLDPSVRDHEPRAALDGGAGGVEILNRFIRQLPDYLAAGGAAILEIDETQWRGTFHIPNCLDARVRRDQFHRRRFLAMRRR